MIRSLAVALFLAICAGALLPDLYRRARTERALAEVQKAGGYFVRDDTSRRRPVISIDLDATIVDDTGRVHRRGHATDATLAHVTTFDQLRELSLNGAEVTDGGLSYLVGLHRLQRLDLRGTRVTLEGVSALRRALPRLEVLTGSAPDDDPHGSR